MERIAKSKRLILTEKSDQQSLTSQGMLISRQKWNKEPTDALLTSILQSDIHEFCLNLLRLVKAIPLTQFFTSTINYRFVDSCMQHNH